MPSRHRGRGAGGTCALSTARMARRPVPSGARSAVPAALASLHPAAVSGRTRPLDRIPGLRELAERQLGVARRDQLAALGVTPRHVRGQVRAQRWRTIGPLVVALSTGALTRAQQMSVALINAGDDAVLAGRTALERHGLRGWEDRRIHVLVGPERRPPRLAGVVAHRTSALEPLSVRADGAVHRAATADRFAGGVGGLPCSTPARAAIDAASWERSAAVATALVIAVVQQRLTRPDDVADVLSRRPRTRHRAALLVALADAGSGAESLREAQVARLVEQAGLGVPRRQVLIQTPAGPRRVDLLVVLPDGRRLVIEVDGPHHLDPRVQAADAERDAELTALGYVVLRMPVAALAQDSARVLESLRRLARPAPR